MFIGSSTRAGIRLIDPASLIDTVGTVLYIHDDFPSVLHEFSRPLGLGLRRIVPGPWASMKCLL